MTDHPDQQRWACQGTAEAKQNSKREIQEGFFLWERVKMFGLNSTGECWIPQFWRKAWMDVTFWSAVYLLDLKPVEMGWLHIVLGRHSN